MTSSPNIRAKSCSILCSGIEPRTVFCDKGLTDRIDGPYRLCRHTGVSKLAFTVKPGDQLIASPYDVPYKAQKRQMSCWYACAKMVYHFRHGADAKVKHLIAETERGKTVLALVKKSALLDDASSENAGATEKDWPVLAEAFGMTALSAEEVGKIGNSFTDLATALTNYGPLWCAGRFYQGGSQTAGHVIVVVGAIQRKVIGTYKPTVVFHDPAPASLQGGPYSTKQFDLYFKPRDASKNGLYTLTETENVPPVMYIPKPVATTV